MSWLDRLRGGFTKTAARLGENLTGLTTTAALDTATLDDIEEALIAVCADLLRIQAEVIGEAEHFFKQK